MQFFHGDTPLDCPVEQVIVAGWTGRDKDAVDHHIQELAELGIAPPSQTPLFYRVSENCLVQSPLIQVLGKATSGEAEPFLLRWGGEVWLGLASDHTDRELEAISVAASKQACPKPVSSQLWRFKDVADHLDDLILRCQIEEGGEWVPYQEGPLARILPLSSLIEKSEFSNDSAMLCGTLPAIGSIRPARSYRMELFDPRLRRTIRLEYKVEELPIIV